MTKGNEAKSVTNRDMRRSRGADPGSAVGASKCSSQGWTDFLQSKFSRLASTFFRLSGVSNFVNASGKVLLRCAWYLPAIFVAAIALTALYSPRAAIFVLLGGCIFFAGGLFLLARLIRQRYYALLERMPKINGQAPKRFEFHAVVLGVGEQSKENALINADDYESDLAEIALESAQPEIDQPETGTSEEAEKIANDDEEAGLDDDSSAFEMYEVPIIRRERVRKTIIH